MHGRYLGQVNSEIFKLARELSDALGATLSAELFGFGGAQESTPQSPVRVGM